MPTATPDSYGAGYVTGNVIGISKTAKNPEAAWELIKYLTTDTKAIVKLANSLKNIPSTKDALASPDLKPDTATLLDMQRPFFDAGILFFNPPLPAERIVDETYSRAAAAQLGPYRP